MDRTGSIVPIYEGGHKLKWAPLPSSVKVLLVAGALSAGTAGTAGHPLGLIAPSTLNLVCVGDLLPNLSLVLETKTLLDHFIALHENTLEVKSRLAAPERKFSETSPYQPVEPRRPGFTGSAAGREESTRACKFLCPLL